jgi:O-acetyl-ADP-ribose deacetylase (regulator of RNase III)
MDNKKLSNILYKVNRDILINCIIKCINKFKMDKMDKMDNETSFFQEMKGDLFANSDNSSLAHCVAKDLGMGKGIAVFFKKIYGKIPELRAQNKEVGETAALDKDKDNYVYYLITKTRSRDKPTLSNLKSSLVDMRNHAIENGVKIISMPRIGSGLDGLDWNDVKNIIKEVFESTSIQINVYYL